MTIFISGCSTCGTNSIFVRRVQRDNPTVEIKNSKYDKDARELHGAYLSANNLPTDNYDAIVVDGDTVTLLRDYQ